MLALNSISNCFTLYICAVNTSVDTLHQLHSELLKRLDDSSDEVRIAISGTFVAYVRYIYIYIYMHLYMYVGAYAIQVRLLKPEPIAWSAYLYMHAVLIYMHLGHACHSVCASLLGLCPSVHIYSKGMVLACLFPTHVGLKQHNLPNAQ